MLSPVTRRKPGRTGLLLVIVALLTQALLLSFQAAPVAKAAPTNVTVAGSLQSELLCPGDWQPDCSNTFLTYDANDDVWQNSFTIPAASYEYKAAINQSWTENYGLHAAPNGGNIPLNLAADGVVKFYYDDKSHWITDNKSSIIATAVGNFQSELLCPGDWAPDCLRSWLQDPDGDGIYTFTTSAIPAGDYEAKVALNENWDVNYGAGGAPGGGNIAFTVNALNPETTFSYNSTTHVMTIAGAQKGNLNQAKALWLTNDTIVWNAAGGADNTYRLYYAPTGGIALELTGLTGGNYLTLTYDSAALSPALQSKYPYVAAAGYGTLKISPTDLTLVPELLKGQLAIQATNTSSGALVDATSLQIFGVLDDLYTYNGTLGVTYSAGMPTLSLWAPTARSVKLHLYADSTTGTGTEVPLVSNPANGVWSVTGLPTWTNQFYVFEVQVYVRSTGQVENNLVTDPYSVSLSTNGLRSQIVNLADSSLKPAGWDGLTKPALAAPEDSVIYELHIRDFSANDQTVPTAHQGKYLAFTDSGSNGMTHLKALALAGLTHVHLLPAFDLASVYENPAQRTEPDPAQLQQLTTANGPASQTQANYITPFLDTDSFNWGYDPFHYNVPDGSYATNPDGSPRILEFRQMVQGLNNAGLRTVMDVVYNHTTASGQNNSSVLDKVVPGYYHRLNLDGNIETTTCCQNTASEHAMMEKLMIDSTVMWAKEYKVDGFRFDLMGHHMRADIEKVRDALHALTLQNDGVDGSKIYLYGEGWDFGEVAGNARGVNATQVNMAGSGVGTFNDRIRDGVRGGGPFSGTDIQGFINGLYYDPNALAVTTPDQQKAQLLQYTDWIRVGMAGNLKNYQFVDRNGATVTGSQVNYNGAPAGYTLDPQEVINYSEAHDNGTLFDANAYKAPLTTSKEDRARIQNLGLDLVMLGQGIPFFQAGQDMMRSKSLDDNSYNSGDWFNKLDFTYQDNNFGVGLPPTWSSGNTFAQTVLNTSLIKPTNATILSTVNHFQDLLKIRKSSKLFRLETAGDIQARLKYFNTGAAQTPGLLVMGLDDRSGPKLDPNYEYILTLTNATTTAQVFTDVTFANAAFELHPILAASTDPVVKTAVYDPTAGSFTVPARTTAVFVVKRAIHYSLLVFDYPSPTLAGTSHDFKVTVLDDAGHPATAYTGTIQFISSDPAATVPANYTFTSADAGSHTFSATFRTLGVQSLTAQDTTDFSIAGTQSGILVQKLLPPVNPDEPPADLTGQLKVSPDRVAANDAVNEIRYTFKVKNEGKGKATAISLTFPINSQLVIGYGEFIDPRVWVSGLTASEGNG